MKKAKKGWALVPTEPTDAMCWAYLASVTKFAQDKQSATLSPVAPRDLVRAGLRVAICAAPKTESVAAGRVQWKRWVHLDDVPALAEYADKLARKREKAKCR